jgi:hypothetical protein
MCQCVLLSLETLVATCTRVCRPLSVERLVGVSAVRPPSVSAAQSSPAPPALVALPRSHRAPRRPAAEPPHRLQELVDPSRPAPRRSGRPGLPLSAAFSDAFRASGNAGK